MQETCCSIPLGVRTKVRVRKCWFEYSTAAYNCRKVTVANNSLSAVIMTVNTENLTSVLEDRQVS